MGANIAGAVAYPAVGSAAHRTGSSCTACHMAESSDGVHGLHTFIIYEESCKQCHTSGVPTKPQDLALIWLR
ncbi:MAG: hypothetical protein U5K51_11370 [Flavobacteriaceae bacterium]|nr:hypothetical protein [Flavobacteriaceae bacterium]